MSENGKLKKLTRAENFKLMRWLDINYERLGRMTRKEAYAEACKELGRPFPYSSISGILEDMGREPPFKSHRSGAPSRDRVAPLAQQMVALIGEVERICGLLGVVFDPSLLIDRKLLVEIAAKKNKQIQPQSNPR